MKDIKFSSTNLPSVDRTDKKLVSAIRRGNKLKTPILYADLAISLMCKSYNLQIENY
jgi:hypothetical protein